MFPSVILFVSTVTAVFRFCCIIVSYRSDNNAFPCRQFFPQKYQLFLIAERHKINPITASRGTYIYSKILFLYEKPNAAATQNINAAAAFSPVKYIPPIIPTARPNTNQTNGLHFKSPLLKRYIKVRLHRLS